MTRRNKKQLWDHPSRKRMSSDVLSWKRFFGNTSPRSIAISPTKSDSLIGSHLRCLPVRYEDAGSLPFLRSSLDSPRDHRRSTRAINGWPSSLDEDTCVQTAP